MKLLLAMKPVENYVQNVVNHSQAGLNIDETRVETTDDYFYPNGPGGKSCHYSSDKRSCEGRPNPTSMNRNGRWPANIILDNGMESCFPELHGSGNKKDDKATNYDASAYHISYKGRADRDFRDAGNVSRFFKKVSK